MDLRMCPSCRQSVLDDEAQECPFCGAAMDGSSGPTKSPQKKSTAGASSGEEGKNAPEKPAESKAKETESDDPFPTEKTSKPKRKVIPLRRKPTAKASYRVVCPMCDTNGFGTPAVAGKEVKCPNSDCMLPIFTAPEMEKEEPEEPKKSLFTPVRVFSVVTVVVLAGIGGFFYAQLSSSEPKKNDPEPNGFVDENNGPEKVDPKPDEPDGKEVEPKPDPLDVAAFRENMMASAIDAARQRSNNRSKPFCRQLNAEAYAAQGNIAEAQEQLVAFDALRSNVDYFKIPALVRIGRLQLARGNRERAEELADEALAYSKRLPRTGIDSVRYAVSLGAFLISLERFDEAGTLIREQEDARDVSSAAVQLAIVLEEESFDLAESARWYSPLPWTSPLAFGACYAAAIGGHETEAIDFLQTLDDSRRQSEGLAGIAAARARQAGGEFTEGDVPQLESISAQGRVMALAQALACLDDDSARQQLADQLTASAGEWDVPAPAQMPKFMAIYEGANRFADGSEHDVIYTSLLLARHFAKAGESARAWQEIERALAATATIGPPLQEAERVVTEFETNRQSVQSRLARELELEGIVESRSAFNQYRSHANTIAAAARTRVEREREIYQAALDWGLIGPLSENELDGLATDGNPNFERILDRAFAADLLSELNRTGKEEAASQIQADWPELKPDDSRQKREQEISRLLEAGNVRQVRDLMNRTEEREWEPLVELRYASQIAQSQPAETVIRWIQGMSSIVEQELAYRLSGVFMTHRKELETYWKATQNENLSATERCSLTLGISEGLATTDVYEQAEPKEDGEAGEE